MVYVDPAFQARRNQVLGGSQGAAPSSSSGTGIVPDSFQARRTQILSAPRPVATASPAAPITKAPQKQQSFIQNAITSFQKPAIVSPLPDEKKGNIFDQIGSYVSKKLNKYIPGGTAAGIERLKKTPAKEFFLPTATQAEPARRYVKDTLKAAVETIKGAGKLSPPYMIYRAATGNPITPKEHVKNLMDTGLNAMGFAWRVQPEAPLIGAGFGSWKGVRQYFEGKITAGELVQEGVRGINEQPGLGEVFTDNISVATAIDIVFMGAMITKPLAQKKLSDLNLRARQLNEFNKTLGVKPNATMEEVVNAFKNKVKQYPDTFTSTPNPKNLEIRTGLTNAYNELKKAGAIEKKYAAAYEFIQSKIGNPMVKPVETAGTVATEPKLLEGEKPLSVESKKSIEVWRAGEFDIKKVTDQGISFTTDKKYAESFGEARNKKIEKFSIRSDAKILTDIPQRFLEYNSKTGEYGAKNGVELEIQGKDEFQDIVDFAKSEGYDAVDLSKLNAKPGETGESEIRVINTEIIEKPQITATTPPLSPAGVVPPTPATKTSVQAPKEAVGEGITARSLVELKTKAEIQTELQKIFGSYKELDELDEIDTYENPNKKLAIADKYMADIERAAVERNYEEANLLLTEAKKELAKLNNKKIPEVSKEAKEATSTIYEALAAGDTEAAKDLYKNFTTEGKIKLPEFKDLEDTIRIQQTEELETARKEIEQLSRTGGDESTEVLVRIADKLGKHFKSPGALWKITGKTRTYETPEGSIQVGGDMKTAFDNLVYATDLEGFAKNVNVLHYKFDKVFTEIRDIINKGDIDGADYEQFKQTFAAIIEKRPVYRTGRGAVSKVSAPKEKPAGKVSSPQASRAPQVKEPAAYGFNPKNLEEPQSPKSTEEVKKIVKRSEIAKALSEKLNIPIRRGKFQHAGALGIYKPGPKVVRIKSGGLQTVFHEVAHYLDDTIGFSSNISTSERTSLMQEYGYSYAGKPDKQMKEAFAEYLRFKMTGQTEKIAKWAPEFDKQFDKVIADMPEVKEVIDTATQDFKRWNEQPATSKILSHLSIGSTGKGKFFDRAIQTMHDLYTSALDDLHPLSEFEKLAVKKLGTLKAAENPYVLARNFRGWVGKADLFLNRGTFGKTFWEVSDKGKSTMKFTGKSYSEIMKPIEKENALDDFRVYIVAQRIVNDLAPRGIKTGITVNDAKQALEELEKKHPGFAAVAKERRAYKDRLLEFAKENGLVGEEGLKKIKELNKYHVPFYRVMEETGAKFLGKSKIAGNIASPIKKIKGSEREIIDPLESDVKDTYAIINAAERNNIGVAMANLAQQNFELGRLFEEVAKPMKPVTVNVKEVLDKALKGTDAINMEIPEDLAQEVVTLFRSSFATGPNMLNVNMGDKQKVFEVDSDLFKAIQGLEVEDVATIFKILSLPAKTLRAGATLSPDFSVRNPLRDQFTAFAYSKYGFIPGVDLVRGMFELWKKGDVYDLWKAGGGEHAMFVSLDRTALQKNLKEVLGEKGAKLSGYIKNPLKILQVMSEFGEAGTRLGEMRNAISRGADPIEAAHASRNITLDFSRIGAKARAVNAIVAFFNANMQGTDTMIRNFKSRPWDTLFKTVTGITLPSVLLYLANRDDPRWKEIPQWQKNLFWIVMTDKHVFRIPKPFELGVLFGSVPERVMEVIDQKDPKLFNDLANTIREGFTPGWMPTFMIPVIENISNYSFFMNRPIVSRGKENLPPSEQAGPYTTEVSKLIGRALNYSPAKIDNLVSGYGGGIGKYATATLDKILTGTGIVQAPPKPKAKLEDLPVIKAFTVREPIGTGSESVNQVYEQYAKTNQQMNHVKQLVKKGKAEEAQRYIKDHPDTMQAIVLNQAVDTFSDLNKAIDMVRESEKLTAQEKRKKIDLIQILQTNVARKVLEEIKKRK